jgi:alpha-L-fucosidase
MPARTSRCLPFFLLAACLGAVLIPSALAPVRAQVAVGPTPVRTAARDTRLDWWREARFGMFIHFGLYAVPAGEWNGRTDYGEWIRNNAKIPLDTYDQFRARFNPEAFDAAAWARQARRAGMRYLVITTKHHDGFGLFDSKQTDFTVMSTPFHRDLLKELADACRREGLRIGWYYSIMDWHHPDYLPRRDWEKDRSSDGADFERYVAYMKAQLRELLTNYGPIDVLWFDGEWERTWTPARGKDLYAYVRSLQPGIVINNRVGKSGGTFGRSGEAERLGDFGTPEQEVPATGTPGVDWETCMTMNRNWGYNRADKDFKSAPDLIRMLADIASKGGNLLLNVGPTSEGVFPQESVERLDAIGRWMSVNGESIYGTQASPFTRLPWGRATQKRLPGGVTRLYLHVFKWPADGRLVVDDLLNLPTRAFLLSDLKERELQTSRSDTALVLSVPKDAPDPTDSVVVLDVVGRPDVNLAPTISAAADIFTDALVVSITLDRDNVEIHYTLDSRPVTALSPLVAGSVVLSSTVVVNARAYRAGLPVSPQVSRLFRKVVPRPAAPITNPEPGLRFECVEGDFQSLPDFGAVKPAASGTAAGFDLSKRTREAQFALRFRGYVRVPKPGVYTFFVLSDDGSKLWIGDTPIVDNDGVHSAREASGSVALAAGLHPIAVAMFERSGGFDLAVSYSGPGLARQPIPAAALYRDP